MDGKLLKVLNKNKGKNLDRLEKMVGNIDTYNERMFEFGVDTNLVEEFGVDTNLVEMDIGKLDKAIKKWKKRSKSIK